MQRTVLVMSGSLSLYSKYIKIAPKEAGFQDTLSSFPHTATFCNCFHAVYSFNGFPF